MLTKKNLSILLAVLLAMAFAQAAFAGLKAMGPVNPIAAPGNGFPVWYQDQGGLAVDLPIPPIGDGLNAPTMIYAPVDPANPYSVQTGFGSEAFYFVATVKNFNTKYGRGTVLIGIEAGYANLVPKAGDQVVFARIRVKTPVQVAGTYTFKHPYGVETITVSQADINAKKAISFTSDIGIAPGWTAGALTAAPGGFYGILQPANPISSFLKMASPLPPAGWLGDGVAVGTVIGGSTGYLGVRLDAPAGVDLDGRGNSFIEVLNGWTVSGHLINPVTPTALTVSRVTCSYIGTTEFIDLFLNSAQGANISVTDTAVPPNVLLAPTPVTDVNGRFYKSFPGAVKSITITADQGIPGTSPTVVPKPVVDYVNIVKASFSVGTNILTVQATSSDFIKRPTDPPVLTVAEFAAAGPMVLNTTSGIYTLSVPVTPGILPPSVTVNSTLGPIIVGGPRLPGGTDTAWVGMAP